MVSYGICWAFLLATTLDADAIANPYVEARNTNPYLAAYEQARFANPYRSEVPWPPRAASSDVTHIGENPYRSEQAGSPPENGSLDLETTAASNPYRF